MLWFPETIFGRGTQAVGFKVDERPCTLWAEISEYQIDRMFGDSAV